MGVVGENDERVHGGPEEREVAQLSIKEREPHPVFTGTLARAVREGRR